MNEINQFPFYKNYYELLDNLPVQDKRLMLEIIVDFVFKDKEPIELKGMNQAIWNNIKLPLANIKKQILNGQKGGRPKKEENPKDNPNQKPNKNPKDNPNKNQIYISNLLFIISNNIFYNNKELLVNKIKEWLEYKTQRKDKQYTEIGFKKLLTQIENNINQYGEEKVINLIDECMGNNYQGIIFDKLKNNKLQNRFLKCTEETKPEWFDKKLKNETLTKEESQELDNELNDLLESIDKIGV